MWEMMGGVQGRERVEGRRGELSEMWREFWHDFWRDFWREIGVNCGVNFGVKTWSEHLRDFGVILFCLFFAVFQLRRQCSRHFSRHMSRHANIYNIIHNMPPATLTFAHNQTGLRRPPLFLLERVLAGFRELETCGDICSHSRPNPDHFLGHIRKGRGTHER